jgi:hypothetical protein
VQQFAFIWGLLSLAVLSFAFLPGWGFYDWLSVPFSMVGVILSFAAFGQAGDLYKTLSILAILLNMTTCVLGLVRWLTAAPII